jgi:Ca2+-binding EF-hand superfamily protein
VSEMLIEQEFDLDMDGEINEQEFINIMTDGA